ncbi:MAG: hypothetical protein WBC62_08200 [Candidatus Macondimonas sp.]
MPLELPSPPSALRWLYIDFNSYFASVEQQLRPELRGKPIAVVPVVSDSTCAIAASYEAKAFGIQTGTPVWEAKRLCPDLICVLARHEHYVAFHHRLLAEVERYIHIDAVCSIDEAACRLMDNEIAATRAIEIAHTIKGGLARNIGEYIRCSIGIAPNRYLAKIAADMQKPDGLTLLEPADLPERVFGLQLRDLPGVGRNMERRLIAAGINDLRTLWALDASQLRRVWGSIWGEKIWYLLRGFDLSEPPTQRRSIGHSHVLAPALRYPIGARHIARRLTLKAASRLRRLDYYASVFCFSIRLEDGARYEVHQNCQPAQDNSTFLELLDQAWQRSLPRTQALRIKKVSVNLQGLVPGHQLQLDLFDHPKQNLQTRQKAEKLSHTLDRINQRFGRDSIQVGMLAGQASGFSGTKIAFTRIPDLEEFLE